MQVTRLKLQGVILCVTKLISHMWHFVFIEIMIAFRNLNKIKRWLFVGAEDPRKTKKTLNTDIPECDIQCKF